MTDEKANANPMFTSPVVYQLPSAGEVRRDVAYGDSEFQVMDIYYPETRSAHMPVVLLVTGYSDAGFKAKMGLIQKDIGWYESWAKLLAASGLITIAYSNADPAADTGNLIEYLRANDRALGVDSDAIAVMAMSANVSNAVALLIADNTLRCGALFYGYTMDVGDAQHVATAAGLYGFAMAKQVDDEFPDRAPMLVLRAGKEENVGLNESLDLFVEEGRRRGAPLTLIDYPEGKHCFDIMDKSQDSIEIVKSVLDFLEQHLSRS